MNIRTISKVVFVFAMFCSMRNSLSEITRIELNLQSKAIYSFINSAIFTCFYKSACLPLHGANDRQIFRLLLYASSAQYLLWVWNTRQMCEGGWSLENSGRIPDIPLYVLFLDWAPITFLLRTSSPRFQPLNFFRKNSCSAYLTTLLSSSGTEQNRIE